MRHSANIDHAAVTFSSSRVQTDSDRANFQGICSARDGRAGQNAQVTISQIWGDLGIPFSMAPAFENKQERAHARQWGIKSEIQEHPNRNGDDPANDPCPGCEHMVCVCSELGLCDE